MVYRGGKYSTQKAITVRVQVALWSCQSRNKSRITIIIKNKALTKETRP